MKNLILTAAIAFLNIGISQAQDLDPNQVPSVIVNNFQRSFPRSSDVEWEKDMDLYKVEFETGLFGTDHEAWYTADGKLIKHYEDISESDLPAKVKSSINKNFSGYRMDDLTKMSDLGKAYYRLELKKYREEWKVIFDQNGKMLQKIAD